MSEEQKSSRKRTRRYFIFNPFATLLLSLTLILVVVYFFFAWKYIINSDGNKNDSLATESLQCAQFRNLAQILRQKFEKTDTGDPSALLTQQQTEFAARLLKVRARYVDECLSGQEHDDWFGTLRGRYETTMSADLMKDASNFENKGKEAMESGDFRLASQSFKMAIKAQNRINIEYPSSSYANTTHLITLEKLGTDANYRPMLQAYKSFKEDGDLLYDKGDYTTARERYTSALSQLRTIAYIIPPSYFDCDGKIRFLEQRNVEIGAKIRSNEVDSLIAEGENAASSGDYEKAGALFAQVLEKQRSIVKEFPNSSMANADRKNQIERKRQTALSQSIEKRLLADLNNFSSFLEASDDNGVQNSICEAQKEYSELVHVYSQSDAAKNPSYKKIPYLFAERADICLLRKAVMEHLREIPGDTEWKMLDREVPQLIYEKICGNNPSARKDGDLPVEGMTLAEAELFAQKLTWIIGKEAKLPDIARYMAVVKPVDNAWVRKGAWNCVTSPERETRPVATSTPDARGYYDLIGNVSEWTDPGIDATSEAVVVGGNVRDNPIRLSEIPQNPHDVGERVRNNGFRVIVKTGGQ